MRLSEFAPNMDGRLISDGEFEILDYCDGGNAGRAVTFLEHPRYIPALAPHIGCVICNESCLEAVKGRMEGIVLAEYPKAAFYQLHNQIAARPGKRFPSVFGEGCRISPRAVVAEHNVVIGDNVVIEDFAVIHENTVIGDDSIIHAHVVVGGKAFVFARMGDGRSVHVEDAGFTELGKRVEVCSLTNIARGILAVERTRLEDDTKVDALVHVGHGVHIGKGSYVVAGAQIGGCTSIGELSWVGVNATISHMMEVGSHARVSLGSVVTKPVGDGQTVSGNFAMPHDTFIKNVKAWAKPDIS